MYSEDALACARLLSRLGDVVSKADLFGTSERFKNADKNWIGGLKFFLYDFAFEHQGRPAEYAPLAVEAVDEVVKGDRPKPTDEEKVWAKFCKLGKFEEKPPYKGTNPKNNPLYPFGGPRGRKDGKDVITFCAGLDASENNNIYRFAKNGIKENLRQTHKRLDGIRGIGPKIASLLLREIVVRDPASFGTLQDRELLQPIDVWLRRTASLLFRDKMSDEAAALQLANLARAANCSDLSFNFGAWYFGSRVAGTLKGLEGALANPEALKKSLEKEAERLKSAAKMISSVLQS